MITIAEVIEQCAQAVEDLSRQFEREGVEPLYPGDAYAEAIRALAAQYKGCIVAEGAPVGAVRLSTGETPLYRAKAPI
jgi:hypothetical protein